MRVFTYKGKKIGTLDEQGVLRKEVSIQKHLMRKTDSWGIDDHVFNEIPEGGEIRLLVDKSKCYTITKKEALDKGYKMDYGFGLQFFIPRVAFVAKEHAK